MPYKNLVIINNEKIFKENNNFYCDNLGLKILSEGLNEYHKVQYIVRNSNKKGIFVSKRDINSFSETTKYIMNNYHEIQKKMEKNVLPTKKNMIKQISDIIKLQNS